jgi:allantoate deiminase
MEFILTGHANHAGTTPMHLRRDALAAAAEWMVEVETMARATEGLVATVGRIDAAPNAANVIPGRVTLSLDVRHVKDATRVRFVKEMSAAAAAIAAERSIELERAVRMDQAAVHMDETLTARLHRAIETAGVRARTMASGAGHDAMVMASRVPTAMLFLRSPGGISHHPDEAVLEEDVETSLCVGRAFLKQLAEDVG